MVGGGGGGGAGGKRKRGKASPPLHSPPTSRVIIEAALQPMTLRVRGWMLQYYVTDKSKTKQLLESSLE